jgi:hypothetical protein
MDCVIDQLADRIWARSEFQRHFADLSTAWLQKELGVKPTVLMTDANLVRTVQAATILAASRDPERRRVAYTIAACAADLSRGDLPGLDGALRIVLTRMGNFPALHTSQSVRGFARLPTPIALSEEVRRAGNRVDLHEMSLDLTDFQRALWEILIRGENVALSAPTSAGKSFVLQAYLRKIAREGKLNSACYIVPSRALIAQVSDAITEWRRADKLRHISLVNVPLAAETPLVTPTIYVLTQERLQATMSAHPEFVVDIIICDEAQSVEDDARGILLQNVIDSLLRKNPRAQMIFAGPNIRNLSVFREIFNLKLLRELQDRSPSVVQNLVLVNTRSLIKGQLTLERFTSGENGAIGNVDIGRSLPSTKERLVRVAEKFGQAKPSIVYANGPAAAENVALGLSDVFSDVVPSERLLQLIAFVKMAVHDHYDLAACLRHRVGFHYGRIPTLVRRGVEAAFADGEIRYLVTTSTLIQGVNFPAANLFICKPQKGNKLPLEPSEFWNLAGRAGRLGREFQGNIFLIDYPEWDTKPANEGNEIELQSALTRTLARDLDAVENCAREPNPPREAPGQSNVEATFARLLTDHITGRLSKTLERCAVSIDNQTRLVAALDIARARISLPADVINMSPTVSALRQQRLADYLVSEIKGGGTKRLEELIPRHPRDSEAYRVLSEVFRVCHEQILTLSAPKLHLRMAAIALKWMRGDPLPEIIDENHRRLPDAKLATSIRGTLKDIEEEVRFKYLRLTICYLAVLTHVLKTADKAVYLPSLPALPSYLEVGASDPTMVSFVGLGVSRVTARVLTEQAMDKEMDQARALQWLKTQNLSSIVGSEIMRADIERALANALSI